MDVSLLTSLREIGHLVLHVLDWTRASPSCAVCPDCVCSNGLAVGQEKVTEALASALTFAQERCGTSGESGPVNNHSWSFNFFWLGLCCGFVLASVCWIAFTLGVRALRSIAGPSPPVDNSAPRLGRTLSLADAADGEPANPRTLRLQGLVR